MTHGTFSFIVSALLFGAFASSSMATQIIQQTPQQLAKESSLIVDGTVTGVRSYWDDHHAKILTEATVAVAGSHKGSGGSTLRVVQLGGVVGNVRMTAQGALQWKRGEEVLLFLEPATPGAFQVTGFSQGKYAIERDAKTGKAYVQQAMPPDTRGGTSGTAAAAGGTRRVTLEQFLGEVLPGQ